MTEFKNEISKEVFEMTYSYAGESVDDMHARVAKNLASGEKDKEYWENKFKEILEDFKFVPGGRILSNAGLDLKGTTYINCFVDGFIGKDKDSMGSIMDALKRQAFILKSEGGYGFNVDVLRPRGSYIVGIANESPGAVEMLSMWDTTSAVITKGSGKKSSNVLSKSKIRKGAQMVTMSCWHPDIEEFITAKQTSGRLTKFNMSVLISDVFIDAIKNNKSWVLEFPDYEHQIDMYKNSTNYHFFEKYNTIKECYEKEWDGNLKAWKEKGLPTTIYKTYEDANELFDLITESTYNRNEPGVLFVDTINRLNNLSYLEYISATNPCGEQLLPIGGVCLLGSLNLTQFIKGKNWDYEKLGLVIGTAVRLMDNVNDVTSVPLKIQEENLKQKRRIGLGIMGYGSALLMMKIRYGSKNALKKTEELMEFMANAAYSWSSLLADEKGSFELFDVDKYMKSEYIKNLSDATKLLISKSGMRNSHLLSIQPTGNTSVLANMVSGGLEPVFLFEYIRTIIIPHPPEGLEVPSSIDWKVKDYNSENQQWQWTKEGDEDLLTIEFEGDIYKIDNNRGLTKEVLAVDYGVQYLKDKNEWDETADWAVNINTLSIDDHINTMAVFSKWIDSAMSKTVNLPNDFSYEEFKNIYLRLHATGTVKGCTTYRDGTMMSVLSSTDKRNGNHIIKTHAPKRPKRLECEVYQPTVRGEQWVVFVGLLGGDPYEVFSFKSERLKLPKSVNHGIMTRIKSGVYRFESDDGLILENVTDLFEKSEEEPITRLLSWGLRHGSGIEFAIDGLNKSEGDIVSFSKSIARTLKKYTDESEYKLKDSKCPQCGKEDSLWNVEGCIMCKNCSWSKC